jgi:FAD:protein FMN transferase
VQGRRLSHTMDPARGLPAVTTPASVTVVAPTCAAADAWATAFMVLGAHAGAKIARQRRLDALFLVRDDEGSVRTVGVGRLFSKNAIGEPLGRGVEPNGHTIRIG